MSGWVAGAVVGSAVIGSVASSNAADKAAGAQERSAEAGVAEQQRQFDETTRLLEPYVRAGAEAMPGFQPFQEAGALAFQQQQALSGLLGPAAQRSAISQLEQDPEFQALTRQGEEALLQRASATGGLRGGNVQAALAQFRPQMLSQQIERQLGRLGGFASTGLGVTSDLASMGQASAARQAALGGQTAANISNLYGQMGAAQAGAALAQGQAIGNVASSIPSALILGRSFSTPAAQTAVLGGGF